MRLLKTLVPWPFFFKVICYIQSWNLIKLHVSITVTVDTFSLIKFKLLMSQIYSRNLSELCQKALKSCSCLQVFIDRFSFQQISFTATILWFMHLYYDFYLTNPILINYKSFHTIQCGSCEVRQIGHLRVTFTHCNHVILELFVMSQLSKQNLNAEECGRKLYISIGI